MGFLLKSWSDLASSPKKPDLSRKDLFLQQDRCEGSLWTFLVVIPNGWIEKTN